MFMLLHKSFLTLAYLPKCSQWVLDPCFHNILWHMIAKKSQILDYFSGGNYHRCCGADSLEGLRLYHTLPGIQEGVCSFDGDSHSYDYAMPMICDIRQFRTLVMFSSGDQHRYSAPSLHHLPSFHCCLQPSNCHHWPPSHHHQHSLFIFVTNALQYIGRLFPADDKYEV